MQPVLPRATLNPAGVVIAAVWEAPERPVARCAGVRSCTKGRPRLELGAWACPSCGAHRAALDLAVAIEGVDRDGWLELAFTRRAHDDVPRVRSLRVRLTGTAGAYDAAAAVLAARAFGIRWDDASSALDGATPAFGRMEEDRRRRSIGDPDARKRTRRAWFRPSNAAAVRHPDAPRHRTRGPPGRRARRLVDLGHRAGPATSVSADPHRVAC